MANTYSQIYIQLIFAVEARLNIIKESKRNDLEKYITKVIANHNSKTIAIYCNPDHIHILVGLNPNIAIKDLVRDIKTSSSLWINRANFVVGKFAWQRGYGAFSYSRSHLDSVCKYILNQPIHHNNVKFKNEYKSFLKNFAVSYDDKYLFDWYDE